LYIKN